MQELVITDQSYADVHTKKGMEWLQSIGTSHITGTVRDAELTIELSRGTKLTGWSGVGMYVAPATMTQNGNYYPDESIYGTRMYFINAEWRGDCQRHLAPTSSFGVIKEHSNTITVKLNDVPTTKGTDGCETGMDSINLSNIINNSGLFLGIAPSDDTYHVKATLRYRGDLSVKPL